MPKLDRPGIFRAEIVDYSLQDSQSSEAVGIACRFAPYQKLEPNGEWVDWNYGQEVYGTVWIIKADGTVNERSHNEFMRASGWDGELESIINKTFQPWPVKIDVQNEEYNGKTQLRVKWINHHDDEGQGMRSIEEAKAKALAAKYSAKFRAIASQAKGTEVTPPPPPPPSQTTPEGDDVPF